MSLDTKVSDLPAAGRTALRRGFVGRSEELETLQRSLRDHAIVTIVGPPGVGKTRLAQEYLETEGERGGFGGKIWFCDLFDTQGAEGVSRSVLNALATQALASTQPEEAVVRIGVWLGQKGAALLVLDNFEHLLPYASMLETWIQKAPLLRILVTSRSSLGLANELVLSLGPMPLQAASSGIADAARLFIERAKVVRGSAEFSESQLSTIQTIVQDLGGMPLSIEIAASLSRILNPSQIAGELDSLKIHAPIPSSQGAHYRTIQEAIAWSWNLLSKSEQEVLAICSVFRGGFSLAAARAVLSPGLEAIGILDSLCERSLLYVYSPQEAPDTLRFAQYPSVRDFGNSQLTPREQADAQERCAAYFLSQGEVFVEALSGKTAGVATTWLTLEVDNLRRIFHCSEPTSIRALRAALVLHATLSVGSAAAFSLTLLEEVLQGSHSGAHVDLRARALLARGHARRILNRNEAAKADFRSALEIAPTAAIQSQALNGQGLLLMKGGAPHDSRSWFERARKAAQVASSRRHEGIAIGNLAWCHLEMGELDQASQLYGRAIDIWNEVGDLRNRAVSIADLGDLEFETGVIRKAQSRYRVALRIVRELGNRWVEGMMLRSQGRCYEALGELDEARPLFDEATACHREVGDRLGEALSLCSLARIFAQQGQLDQATKVLEEAEDIFQTVPANETNAVVLAISESHLNIARAHYAARAGDFAEASKCLGRSEGFKQSQDTEAAPLNRIASRSHLIRELLRGLDRAQGAIPLKGSSKVLLLGPNANWLEAGPQRVDLTTKGGPRRLLLALALNRLSHPGQALRLQELFVCGWPKEVVSPESAASRVYVALSTLRKLGLKKQLLKRDDGYLLDPGVPLFIRKECP